MTYPVKWFSSRDAAGNPVAGAPVLSGAAGSLITVLDACLLTGYGTVSVASLIVSRGVATATVSAGHGFLDQQIVLIAGSSIAALNGEQRITRVSSTTFTFNTTAADGTATGSITAKIAPAGWAKEFSGTTRAVYRATDVQGRRWFYRIDDSAGYDAALRGYRSMTDVDSGAYPFPASDTVRIAKVESGTSASRWVLLADAHGLYLFVGAYQPDPITMYAHGLGDLGRLAATDVYCSCVAGWPVGEANTKLTGNAALGSVRSLATSAVATAGLPSGWANETAVNSALVVGDGGGVWASGLTGPSYPGPHGGALVVPLHCAHGGAPRGRMRGLYGLLHSSGWTHLQPLDIGGGRRGLVVRCYQTTSGAGQVGALVVALDDWEAP